MQNTSMSVRSSTKLNRFGSAAIAGTLCVMLLAPAGCTRTDDGSVVMARPTGFGWGLPGFRRAEPEPAATNFPPPPQQATVEPRRAEAREPRFDPPATRLPNLRRQPTRMTGMRIGVKPPFQQSPSGKPLNCKNTTTPTGRVKVVCE